MTGLEMDTLQTGGIVIVAVTLVQVLGRVFDRLARNGNPGHFTPNDREKHDKMLWLLERMEKNSQTTTEMLRLHVERFDVHLRDFRCLAARERGRDD